MNAVMIVREEEIQRTPLRGVQETLLAWPARVSLLILGDKDAPDEIDLSPGFERVMWIKGGQASEDMPNLAASLHQYVAGFDLILLLEERSLRPLAARIAAHLHCTPVTDVTAITAPLQCLRSICSGQAEQRVKASGKQVWTLRRQAFEQAVCPVPQVTYAVEKCCWKIILPQPIAGTSQPITLTRPPLTQAKIVVGGGRGVGARQWNILEAIADKLDAGLGVTRALVDAGYFTEQAQVGQTGKQIAPQIYLACGISGAIQHVAGITNSKVIVAINHDPEAPIIKRYADYYLLSDVADVLPRLLAQL
ncbi:electron transfer flavoprotein subunit alpha/FixB family protein [Dryocola clanedunensis]